MFGFQGDKGLVNTESRVAVSAGNIHQNRASLHFGFIENLVILLEKNLIYTMKRIVTISLLCLAVVVAQAQIADKATYLSDFMNELYKKWPNNKMQNLVFHGHSVPTGYFNGGTVHPFESYPHYVYAGIKESYPYAVVNCIRSSIGGENAKQGAARFETTVLNYLPDVLFIDYSLNDRGISLDEARTAWVSMIEKALARGVKVILLTPTPDTTEDITDDAAPLAAHARQVRELAETYHVGLVDSYALFKEKALAGEDIRKYMSQNNHPNAQGHRIVADAILEWFFAADHNRGK